MSDTRLAVGTPHFARLAQVEQDLLDLRPWHDLVQEYESWGWTQKKTLELLQQMQQRFVSAAVADPTSSLMQMRHEQVARLKLSIQRALDSHDNALVLRCEKMLLTAMNDLQTRADATSAPHISMKQVSAMTDAQLDALIEAGDG